MGFVDGKKNQITRLINLLLINNTEHSCCFLMIYIVADQDADKM